MSGARLNQWQTVVSGICLWIALAVLQGPLWRPAVVPRLLTAKAGGTSIVRYDREIDTASIFQKRTASLTAGGPHELVIHAHAPGRTSMIIHYKNGESSLYDIVVLPEAL